MILPVVGYGNAILRKVATDIPAPSEELTKLIEDMWETMYASNGVGLAAPQINKSIRLFVVDTVQVVESFDEEDKRDFPNEEPIKAAFINAHIVELSGEPWIYNEGCLSIPGVREDVKREAVVTLRYVDEQFQPQERTFKGLTARVILHEYDHLEGILHIDHVGPLKKRLMKKKLDDIMKGKVKVNYKMIFAGK